MGVDNLAVVFAPTIMKSAENESDPMKAMREIGICQSIIRMLILDVMQQTIHNNIMSNVNTRMLGRMRSFENNEAEI